MAQQILTSITIIRGDDGTNEGRKRIQQLADNSIYFAARLREMGFIVYGDEGSPVIPLLVFNPAKIPYVWKKDVRRIVLPGNHTNWHLFISYLVHFLASCCKEKLPSVLLDIPQLPLLPPELDSVFRLRTHEKILVSYIRLFISLITYYTPSNDYAFHHCRLCSGAN